ncbi:MAG: hypothetical protein A2Y17_11950 [Clostridiales bacterium GWF2_38_85]|nr:MAG: hypothetical protein A2Y17_11950 [Clostridiales bacterium GWF2_38_85]HBL85415.1 hypothetical protein [Clostridiales bacterium]
MPSIEKIRKALLGNNIDSDKINQLLGDDMNTKDINAIADSIRRLEKAFTHDETVDILSNCACCIGGQRNKDCRQFAKVNKDKALSEKVNLLSTVKWMGNPVLYTDGTIYTGIYGKENDIYKCPCWCLKGKLPNEPMSLTYCACCAGHFRYHYQNALGVKLKIKEIVSSALNSVGEKPCEFIYEIIED